MLTKFAFYDIIVIVQIKDVKNKNLKSEERKMNKKRLVDIITTSILSAIVAIRGGIYGISIWHTDVETWGKLFISLITFGGALAFVYVILHIGVFESFGTKVSTRQDFIGVMRYLSLGFTVILMVLAPIYFCNSFVEPIKMLSFTTIPCIVASLAVYFVYRIIEGYEYEEYKEGVEVYEEA